MAGTSRNLKESLLAAQEKGELRIGAQKAIKEEPEELPMEALTVESSGIRREVWLFLVGEVSNRGFRKYAQKYEFFSVGLVIYLVLADIILSIPELAWLKTTEGIVGFEFFIYLIFTMEYVLRMWACMADKELSGLGSCRGRLKLARKVMNLVDLLVCAAYYINFLPGMGALQGMGALRMIRLLRVAALLKVERKTNSIGNIVKVLALKKTDLASTVFMASVLMVMAAAVMYYIEVGTQPVVFGSIPASLWWSVTALTTVGYGDAVPQTGIGKLSGCIIAFFGVGIFALPAGILGEGFMEVMEKPAEAEMAQTEQEVRDVLLVKEQKAMAVKEQVDSLSEKIVRVKKDQERIQKLIRGLTPELAAQVSQGQIAQAQAQAVAKAQAQSERLAEPQTEATSPMFSGRRNHVSVQVTARPSETVSLGASGLAARCASVGDKELADLQDRVQQKLMGLSSKRMAFQSSQPQPAVSTQA